MVNTIDNELVNDKMGQLDPVIHKFRPNFLDRISGDGKIYPRYKHK